MKRITLVCLTLCLTTLTFAQTAPIWVSPFGSGTQDGSSPANAIKWSGVAGTIEYRITHNYQYDFELWLLYGTYTEGERFHYVDTLPINTLRIFGGFNGHETNVFERDLSTFRSTIELNSQVGLHIEGPNLILLDGISFGPEVYYADSAAINLVGANTYVSKCRFEGIHITTDDQILKTENSTTATTKYLNCLVSECDCGGLFGSTGDIDIINCTITANKFSVLQVFWGGFFPINHNDVDAYVYNSIIYENSFNHDLSPVGTTYLSHSGLDILEYWMYDDGSCSYAYPDFANTGSDPFSLTTSSPYIGFGDPAYMVIQPYILQEQDIISMHRYLNASHSGIDAGAYQIIIDDEDEFDFTTTGFDFDFILFEDLQRRPVYRKNEAPHHLNVSSDSTHEGVYSIDGIRVSETTANLPSGLYIVNGIIQWIP